MADVNTENKENNINEEELFEGEEVTTSEVNDNELVEEEVDLTLEEQLEISKNEVLLAHADVQNMRRRTDEEIATARKYGVSSLARDLFMVGDSLRMALMSISDEDKENNQTLKNLSFGLDMVANEFNKAFDNNGIKQILPTIGDDFDHNLHQATGEIESDDVEAGKIAQVMSSGYLLHDRLLKPAMVNTSKKS